MATGDMNAQIDNLIRIGIALSSERDIDVLLEMIVEESRRFTRAEGGSLYTVSDDRKSLDYKIVQNETMGIRVGGTSSEEIDAAVFKPIPLAEEGQINLSNVSAYAANTGKPVNIPDVYKTEAFDFAGPREFDARAGYRTKSMLVVPLRDHEDEIIGVLQLMNSQAPDRDEVVPFSPDCEDLVTSLASQAAVGITNARLIRDLQNLFDAFIQTIAAAIDEKSASTAGHVRRVAELTMKIAEEIDRTETGIWGKVKFTPDELTELRIAAWMHDVGKITTPEYVVDKATKLETIYDRIGTVRARYEVLKRDAEIAALKEKIRLLSSENGAPDGAAAVDARLKGELKALQEELDFIAKCNTGGEFMPDEDVARLHEIASRTYRANGEVHPHLTKNEVYNLSIRKGTLTDEERRVINNHAVVSIKMLSQLPFSRKLRRVPDFAGGHHEKPNGQGYPKGLKAEELPLQARIMAVADIFEALTAPDRVYRQPIPLTQALKILGFMVKDGELDGRIVDLFAQSDTVMQYAREELNPEQIDL